MTNTELTDKQRSALRLIEGARRMTLTHAANVLVSSQARGLQRAGLIEESPDRWIAYRLTAKGKALHDEDLLVNPRVY